MPPRSVRSGLSGALDPVARTSPFMVVVAAMRAAANPRRSPMKRQLTHPEERRFERRRSTCKQALTSLAIGLAAALVVGSAAAHATGPLARLDVVGRPDARLLPTIPSQGRVWVVGTPGQEYSLRICNSSGGRVLAVTSVDGVNVITGETAAPGQSGYVLDPWGCVEIGGWRKSLERTAAFYFTDLPDSYAARTGRPDNLGVIGVALYRERARPAGSGEPLGKIAAEPRSEAPAAAGAARSDAAAGDAQRSREGAAGAPLPQARSLLGTGHGRSEVSHATQVAFERATREPAETIAIHYDRRENLVAMGILPPPVVAQVRPANPFPAWPQFVPDPPRR
jgi:hypothetical protein